MAKDPALLWYPADWLSGTQGMSFEEKGAYMELLMMQFNRGHMTEHMIRRVIGQVWDDIKFKFKQDENGLWYQERLDEEKIKRQKFVESRRNNKKGKNQHSTKKSYDTSHGRSYDHHMTEHMGNENINIIIDNNKDISKLEDITTSRAREESGKNAETEQISESTPECGIVDSVHNVHNSERKRAEELYGVFISGDKTLTEEQKKTLWSMAKEQAREEWEAKINGEKNGV